MNRKRVGTLISSIVLASLAVTACSSGNGKAPASSTAPSSTTTPAPANKEVKLTFWHIWGADREPILKGILDDFMKLHPNIKVEAILQPNQEYGTKAMTALLSSQAPDVMMMFTDTYTQASRSGRLQQVDEWMKRDKILPEDYLAGAASIAQVDKKWFGLPYVLSGGDRFIALNNKLFKAAGLDPAKPPKTWAEFADYTKKMLKTEGGNISILGNQTMEFHFALYNNGGKLISDDGQKAAFNSPEGLETLKFLVQQAEIQGGQDAVAKIEQTKANAPGGYLFYADKVGMQELAPFAVNQLKNLAPTVDYSIMPLPVGPKGKATALVEGAWINTIPASGKNKDAAWELVKYMTYGEGMQKFMAAQTRFSTVKKYNQGADLAKIKEGNKFADQILSIMDTSLAMPAAAGTAEFKNILTDMRDKALYKKMSPEDALKEAEAKANEVIKKFNDAAK